MVIHGLLQNKKEFKELVSNLFYRRLELTLVRSFSEEVIVKQLRRPRVAMLSAKL